MERPQHVGTSQVQKSPAGIRLTNNQLAHTGEVTSNNDGQLYIGLALRAALLEEESLANQ